MKLACDVHTHTLSSSHAYSTIQENVQAAHARGLELLGSADHFSPMIAPSCDFRSYQHFLNQSVWPRVWDGVVVLRACEVDIVDLEGHLFGWDIPVERAINEDRLHAGPRMLKQLVFRDLDYGIASLHGRDFCRGISRAEATRMYIGALHDPDIAILGHAGRSGVAFDIDEVVAEAAHLGKMIEINEYSFSMAKSEDIRSVCRRIAVACADQGVRIAVNSDAHIAPAIGCFDKTEALLEEIDFPEELIATRSAETFIEALALAGVAQLQDEIQKGYSAMSSSTGQ